MKVSVITIIYNNCAYIGQCIQSVAKQTYPDIEHIVIDGCSTDGSQPVIESYKTHLACYISEKDNGLYNALNKGISKSSGDIIGILHSDDLFYDSETISKVVSVFENTNADLVYAKGKYVSKENINKVKRIYPSNPFVKRRLIFGWIPLHTTIFVRREVFEKYGLYEEDYRIAGDYEISLRWFTNDTIKKVYLNEWVVKMRVGGKSTTAKLQKLKSKEDLTIIRKYGLGGYFVLGCKILRKIPQYLIPLISKNV
jgi:glycosyltransferase